jgi:hypothetical protein
MFICHTTWPTQTPYPKLTYWYTCYAAVAPHVLFWVQDHSLFKCTNWSVSGAQWLRHCTTNWKVAGSVPDGVIGIFHWHNPSSHTMALGLTQPLTEMSTIIIRGGQRRPVRRVDNRTTFMYRLSWNLGTSTSWNPMGLSRPVMRLFYYLVLKLVTETIPGFHFSSDCIHYSIL